MPAAASAPLTTCPHGALTLSGGARSPILAPLMTVGVASGIHGATLLSCSGLTPPCSCRQTFPAQRCRRFLA